jgi:hypothetical protein
MKNKLKITEKTIRIEVFNFNEEMGYLNTEKVSFKKMENKDAYIEYPTLKTLKLTSKQERLLLTFINSL